MKAIKMIIILLFLSLGFYFFSIYKMDHINKHSSKPTVAVSTFVFFNAAKAIGGNTMNCFMIAPIGADIEEFKPTPKMMARLSKAKLIIYSGAGLEPWIKPFLGTKKTLKLSRYIKLRYVKTAYFKKIPDPHYWLNINNMITVAKVLSDKFTKLFPSNKAIYQANATKFINKLEKLKQLYKSRLSRCQKHTLIVGHDAFSYLGNEFGFGVDSISGLSPDTQPSAKTIERIIKDVKDNNVSTIFFIPFTNPSVMKNVASQTHTKIGILQPIVNITKTKLTQHPTYFSLMMKNLGKISDALECR